MLVHVTATHSEDNCPGFNTEMIPEVVKGLESREEIAKRHNVKLLGFWSGAPDHVFFSLVEANSSHDIDRFLMEATPFKQAFRLTPVIAADDLIQLGKELAAQARR